MQEFGPNVPELSDEHLEAMQNWLHSLNQFEGALTGCLRVLGEIEDEHGISGLAAIGQLVKDIAEEHLRDFPETVETADEIRAKCLAGIEPRIARMKEVKAHRDMRMMPICSKCTKYRWGRKWLRQPIPPGYIRDAEMLCDDCRETHLGPRSN